MAARAVFPKFYALVAGGWGISLMDALPAKPLFASDLLGTDEYEAVSRIERGISADSVAAQLGRSLEWVQEVLRSEGGRYALLELRAQREYNMLIERESWIGARKRASSFLTSAFDDPNATFSNKLSVAQQILDRDPERAFTKVERKEVTTHHEIGFNRQQFTEHLGTVLGQVGCLPATVLEARYTDVSSRVLPDTPVEVTEEVSLPDIAPADQAALALVEEEVGDSGGDCFDEDEYEGDDAMAPEVTGDFKRDQEAFFAAREEELGRKLTKDERRELNRQLWRERNRAKTRARRAAPGIRLDGNPS